MRRSDPVSVLVMVVLMAGAAAVPAREIVSYAFVQDDGTLVVRGKTIHLFGIYVPPTGRTCRTYIRPVQCGSRAALALKFKIGADFVHCDTVHQNEDGSLTAVCRVDGEDLSAYLLSYGWAVALPDAPIEYRTLEKIARHKDLGVWGFYGDVIQR